MLHAMPIIVFKVIALVFQRVEGLVFDFPPGATSSHEVKDIAFGHPQVGDPAEVLDLVLAPLSVLDKIDPHLRVRRIEGDIIEKAKPMDQPCGAVVPFIILKRCTETLSKLPST
jgi:hypothetical protein